MEEGKLLPCTKNFPGAVDIAAAARVALRPEADLAAVWADAYGADAVDEEEESGRATEESVAGSLVATLAGVLDVDELRKVSRLVSSYFEAVTALDSVLKLQGVRVELEAGEVEKSPAWVRKILRASARDIVEALTDIRLGLAPIRKRRRLPGTKHAAVQRKKSV